MQKKIKNKKNRVKVLQRWVRYKAFCSYKNLVRTVEEQLGYEIHAC